MGELCHSLQLIDGDGEFNVAGLEEFVKAVKLNHCGLSYAVVGIMGPQSSGKSTLLNHLFHTNFKEMDADEGRSQTTKGIWIANCVGIEPLTIVLDLEGADGRERGEDDTAFEKRSALFALAISDIVLINMWCHDIGREHAANKPLLRTIFQVMTRLFSPRKKTLLFVIRDKTKTPLQRLEALLKKDIQKIWDAVSKPKALKNTPLSEFFNVEVIALSSYEDKEEQFKEQVAQLRKRFFNSTSSGGLAADRRGVVPASAFPFSAQKIWEVIRENKDLNIPAHKVMVATIRCEEIANEKLSSLARDQDLMGLKAAVQAGPVSGFGKKASSIVEAYLSEYDKETVYFDENIRDAKRLQLKEKSLNCIHPQYLIMLRHLRTTALEKFKTHLKQSLDRGQGFATSVRSYTQSCMVEFDYGCADASVKQAEWDDDSKVRKKLHADIVAHSSSVRGIKLSEIAVNYENKLTGSLTEPLPSLFESGGNDQWASVRELLRRETEVAISGFSTALAKFELDEETFNKMVKNLKDYATTVVEKKAREEAGKILDRMKDRFSKVFYHDNDSKRRVWTGTDQIQTMGKEACSASLKLLSVMAAIRLNEEPDTIENTLFSCLVGGDTLDPLASGTWEKVPPSKTLITPGQCKSLWKQFVEYAVDMINSELKILQKNGEPDDESWPPWLIAAAVVGVAATGWFLGLEIGAMLLLG